MKILIAGSCPAKDPNFSSFSEIVAEVTEVLVKNNAVIIVGSSRQTTADFAAMQKIEATDKDTNVMVFYHEEGGIPFQSSKVKNLDYRRVSGGWQAGRIPQISEADCVITFGGSNKTELIIRMSSYLGKPVIPVFRSGGASEVMWDEVKNAYPKNQTTQSLISEVESWNSDRSAKSLMALITVLQKASKPRLGWQYYMCLFALLALSISGWFWSFSNSISAGHVSLFASSVSACLVGAMVPLVVRNLTHLDGEWHRVVMIPIASLILSFVLFLAYLFSGFIVNGDLAFFSNLSIAEHFNRTCITLSLLSLSGGVLIENRLKDLEVKGLEFSA